jgi:chemotaxis protein methyltransferase CheR
MEPASLTEKEFAQFRQFLFEAAGISLSPAKKALVSGRLAKRLRHHQLPSYGEYYRLLSSGRAQGELQTAIDLLTTNETYFFREPKHFDFMRARLAELGRSPSPVRVWSAASSSGEEGYTIAMVLAQALGSRPWEVVGTDISSRMVARARTGHYPIERARHVPHELLTRYCLKGSGRQEGTLLVTRELRERVRFIEANLNAPLPDLGMFDFVFLRNVMIYFEMETKRQVVRRMLPALKRGGYLFIGHSETLNEVTDAVKPIKPAIYLKP